MYQPEFLRRKRLQNPVIQALALTENYVLVDKLY